MANNKHVAMLEQGVNQWNNFRNKNNELNLDLSGADLSRTDILAADFRGANLSGVKLCGAFLFQADLRGADLSGATLTATDLSGADLTGADLRGADLTGAYLTGADLSGADLIKANLSEVQINQDTVIDKKWRLVWEIINQGGESRNLSGANLIGAYLRGVDLSGTNLRGAKLRGAYLLEADLSGANLTEAYLSWAYLSGAYLFQANLHRANLRGAYLKGAYLREADLSEANLGGANLNEANLRGAYLGRTEALKTNFQGATFTEACVEDWKIDSATNLDDAICEFVYLQSDRQQRLPEDINKYFSSGEFTRLFQLKLNTVELVFQNGINWQAFLNSLQKLTVENSCHETPVIRGIENRDNGVLAIRFTIPSNLEAKQVEKSIEEEYQRQFQAIVAESQNRAKDIDLAIYHRQSADLMVIAKILASRPINNFDFLRHLVWSSDRTNS